MTTKNAHSVKIFIEDLHKEYDKKVLAEFNRRKHQILKELLSRLIDLSPFKTGTYIANHQVSVGGKRTAHKKLQIGVADRMSISTATYYNGAARIDNTRWNDTVFIYNTAPHAPDVEYIGWPHKPAHHVYGKAAEWIRFRAKQIMEAGE